MTIHRALKAAGLLVAVMVLFGLPASSRAQVHDVTVRVDGLSCPFCAYSLEKKLKAVGGVRELSIDIKEGVARLVPGEDAQLDFVALPQAVEKAGFTPRGIRATGVARLAHMDERPALVDLEGRFLFLLEANAILDELPAQGDLVFDFTGEIVLEAGDEEGTDEVPPRLALTVATVRPDGREG